MVNFFNTEYVGGVSIFEYSNEYDHITQILDTRLSSYYNKSQTDILLSDLCGNLNDLIDLNTNSIIDLSNNKVSKYGDTMTGDYILNGSFSILDGGDTNIIDVSNKLYSQFGVSTGFLNIPSGGQTQLNYLNFRNDDNNYDRLYKNVSFFRGFLYDGSDKLYLQAFREDITQESPVRFLELQLDPSSVLFGNMNFIYSITTPTIKTSTIYVGESFENRFLRHYTEEDFSRHTEIIGEIELSGNVYENGVLLSNTYAPLSHTHTTSDITDLSSYTSFNNYYTKTEVNDICGNLNDLIDINTNSIIDLSNNKATIENNPVNNRIVYWDNNNKELKTDKIINVDNSNNLGIGTSPFNSTPYILDIRKLDNNDTRVMINDCSICQTETNASLNIFIAENDTKEHIHLRRKFTNPSGTNIKDFGISVDEEGSLTMGKYDANGNYEELIYINENHTIEVDGNENGDFVITGDNITLKNTYDGFTDLSTNLNTNYYTKTEVNDICSNITTYIDGEISDLCGNLNNYIDGEITDLCSNITTYIDTEITDLCGNLNTYIDDVCGNLNNYIDGEITDLCGNLNTYIDGEITDLCSNITTYIDGEITDLCSNITTYIDTEITDLCGNLNDLIDTNATDITNLTNDLSNNYYDKTTSDGRYAQLGSSNTLTGDLKLDGANLGIDVSPTARLHINGDNTETQAGKTVIIDVYGSYLGRDAGTEDCCNLILKNKLGTGRDDISANLNGGSIGFEGYYHELGYIQLFGAIRGRKKSANDNTTQGILELFASTSSAINTDNEAGLNIVGYATEQKVGIGKIDPSYKLEVNGDMNATTIYENGTALTSKYAQLGSSNTFTDTINIDTDTNNKPLEISRLGDSDNQLLKIGVSDTGVLFNYINDEDGSVIQFRMENTDTESGGGADANTRYPLVMKGNKDGTYVSINNSTGQTDYTFGVNGDMNATTIYENDTALTAKYAQLGTSNTFTENITIAKDPSVSDTILTISGEYGRISLNSDRATPFMRNHIRFDTDTSFRGNGLLINNYVNKKAMFIGNPYDNNSTASPMFVINVNKDTDTAPLDSTADYIGRAGIENLFVLVGDTGNVGIGTTTPTRIFQISGSNPYMRIHDTGGADGALLGIGAEKFKLWTNYNTNNDTSWAERLTINCNNGYVGIGTSSPSRQLEVYDSGDNCSIYISNGTNGGYSFVQYKCGAVNQFENGVNHQSTNAPYWYVYSDRDLKYVFTANRIGVCRMPQQTTNGAMYFNNSDGTIGLQFSDIRLKKDIEYLDNSHNRLNALNEVMNYRPIKFKWKDEEKGDKPQISFIAQELETAGEFSKHLVDGKKYEYEFKREPIYREKKVIEKEKVIDESGNPITDDSGNVIYEEVEKTIMEKTKETRILYDSSGNPLLDYDRPRYRGLNDRGLITMLTLSIQQQQQTIQEQQREIKYLKDEIDKIKSILNI